MRRLATILTMEVLAVNFTLSVRKMLAIRLKKAAFAVTFTPAKLDESGGDEPGAG